MPRPPATETRMTLYRLTDLPKLSDAIREKYNTSFQQQRVKVGSRDALLLFGRTDEKPVGWGKTVSSLTSVSTELTNSVPAAVLLIPMEEPASDSLAADGDPTPTLSGEGIADAWAATFGMGFQLLDQKYVDHRFGLRVAIRSADRQSLSSVTKVTLEERPKTDRSSIPSGAPLRSFGFEDIGEVATRLVTAGNVEGIGASEKKVMIRGADALSLPLSKGPERFLVELDRLAALLDRPPANEELAALEKLSLIKDESFIEQLEEVLIEALLKPADKRLALAWPHEIMDEFGTPQAFKLVGTRERKIRDGLPTLEDIRAPIIAASTTDPRKKLKSLAILLFESADAETPASPKLPARKWMSFETELDGLRCFLHNGRWYLMEQSYAALIQERTREIFNRSLPVAAAPDWGPDHADELAYNTALADHWGGVPLDRKLIRGEMRRGSFEACDVLLPHGVFVHTKRIGSSAPASHLLSQALVSAEVLSYDSAAQGALRDLLVDQEVDLEEFSVKPKSVIIIFVHDNVALTADSLFTFTQVNLGRQDRALAARGIDVYVTSICRTPYSTGAQ